MTWLEKNGAAIQRIYVANTEAGRCPYVEAAEGVTLTLRAEYMGDRTEVWIEQIEAGRTVAHINARCVETIVWA